MDRIQIPGRRVLTDALEQVHQDRGQQYGPFCQVAETAQEIKLALRRCRSLNGDSGFDTLSCEEQESLDLIATKMARIVSAPTTLFDDWLDIAGYSKLIYGQKDD